MWYPNDSSYRHELHEEGAQLSSKILEKLTALGLTDRGIKVRDSERVDGEGPFYYPDGSIQDYYTVIEAVAKPASWASSSSTHSCLIRATVTS